MARMIRPMSELSKEFTNKRTWAIVGATQDTSKFGYKIFNNLKNAGYLVYGINPRGGKIGDFELYPKLESLQNKVKMEDLVVDIVVPPSATEKVVEECKSLGIKRIWMQPGSESSKAIEYCHQNGIDVVHDMCAMIQRKNWDKL